MTRDYMIDKYIEYLSFPDRKTRFEGVRGLERSNFESLNIEVKVRCLLLRENIEKIVEIGEKAIPTLIEGLVDNDWIVNQTAVEVLGRVAEKIGINKINKAIQAYVSEESEKGGKAGISARKNVGGKYWLILQKIRKRKQAMQRTLSNGIPKPPAGRKGLVRMQRAVRV